MKSSKQMLLKHFIEPTNFVKLKANMKSYFKFYALATFFEREFILYFL